jgi:hypothetical protein
MDNVPDNLKPGQYDAVSGHVLLSFEDMKSLFDSTLIHLRRRLSLVMKLYEKEGPPIASLIVSGAIAGVPYFHDALGQWCDRKSITMQSTLFGR